MPVGFITHPDYRKHVAGPGHPERPERIRAVLEAVARREIDEHLQRIDLRGDFRHECARRSLASGSGSFS